MRRQRRSPPCGARRPLPDAVRRNGGDLVDRRLDSIRAGREALGRTGLAGATSPGGMREAIRVHTVTRPGRCGPAPPRHRAEGAGCHRRRRAAPRAAPVRSPKLVAHSIKFQDTPQWAIDQAAPERRTPAAIPAPSQPDDPTRQRSDDARHLAPCRPAPPRSPRRRPVAAPNSSPPTAPTSPDTPDNAPVAVEAAAHPNVPAPPSPGHGHGPRPPPQCGQPRRPP